MTAVEESLYASRSYLVASKTIDRENWLAFQASQRLETFHPATLGIGLALEVSEADKNVYVSAIRRREQPDYTIWPSGDRPIYVPIRFAASHNGDRRALGFDMFAEPRRRAAMERARDTGEPSLSGVVTLIKAGAMENQQSVVLFLPLYKHALPAGATIEQRRAAIQGYVYCPILIAPFWQNIIDKAAQHQLAMRITDGYGSTVLSTYRQARAKEGESPSVRVSTNAYGQPWLTEYEALPGFAPTPFGGRVQFVALTGTLISFLLTALVWTLVSTRRRAETIAGEMTNRLRESENLFRTLWETTTDAIVLLDDQGRIRYANPALRDIFGHEPAEITGKNISVLQPEALRAGHQAGFSRFLRTGKRRLDWRSIETRGLHRQGHEFSIEISFSQLEVEGRPGFASFMRDITERKRAHQAVRESEQRLNFALEAAGIGDWDMDLRTNTTRRSMRHDQCFGYSEPVSDWGYDTFLAHVHPADRDRVDAAYQKAMSGGEIYDEEFRVTWPDGSLHWLWSKGRFYRDDSGRPYRVAGIEVDITERKQVEEALAEYSHRMRAMSRQLLDVQENERRTLARELHDTVGQELTAISLNLALIRGALPGALARRMGARLEDSEKLLEAASGRLRDIMAHLRPPGIDELGFMAVFKEHARAVAERSELKLTIEGAETRQRFAPETAIALFRIGQEALNNSVKHAQASAIGVKFQDEPDVVRLTLYDNGRGFDAGRKRALGAYGMGMTTMRERAEAIGARLSIDAAPGRGTRISVEIPRAVATGAPAHQKSES